MRNVGCPIMRHHKCLQLAARKTTSEFTTKLFPLLHKINLNPSITSVVLPVSEQIYLPHARFLSLTLDDGSIAHTLIVVRYSPWSQITVSRYPRPQGSRVFGDLRCSALGEYHFLFIFAAGWILDFLLSNTCYLHSIPQSKKPSMAFPYDEQPSNTPSPYNSNWPKKHTTSNPSCVVPLIFRFPAIGAMFIPTFPHAV